MSKQGLTDLEKTELLKRAILADSCAAMESVLGPYPELINFEDELGETPLHWAAAAHKLTSVGYLVDHGANTSKPSKAGYLPAWFANDELRMGCLTEVCLKIRNRIENR